MVEDEAQKRISELVEKRVEEELEKRRDEIEAEVMRRVEEAKKIMEKELLEEIERRKQEQLHEMKRKEVSQHSQTSFLCKCLKNKPILFNFQGRRSSKTYRAGKHHGRKQP